MRSSALTPSTTLWGSRRTLCSIVSVGFLSASTTAVAEGWNYLNGIHGRGYVICDAIRKRLENLERTRGSALARDFAAVANTVLGFPGWKLPPWQDLDPQEHRDLIRELLRYEKLGADVYFGRKKPVHAPAYDPVIDQQIEETARLVHRIRVWRVRLISWLDDKPAPETDQTAVNLLFRNADTEESKKTDESGREEATPDPGLSFLVTDDMRSPNPLVGDWHARDIRTTLLFGNEPHFLTVLATARVVAISRDFGSGPSSFCELQFELPAQSGL